MQYQNKSSDNIFTSEKLSRLTEKRNDETWVREQRGKSNTFFIPILQEKNLINVSFPEPKVAFLKKDQLKNFFDDNIRLTLIGELDGSIYFSFPLNNKAADIEKELSKLGIFTSIRKYAALLNKDEATLLSYANALNNWQKHHLFCGKCGSKTNLGLTGHRMDCSNSDCRHQSFPRTDPAIITLIYRDNKCLLVRQKQWQPGQYALVAGFVEPGESLESAVARETYEETGIELDEISYFSAQPWPFPGSIMIGFFAKAITKKITLHDDELEDAKWMTRDEIIEGIKNKTLKHPTTFSIAYRLLETWFNKSSNGKFSEIIFKLNK